MFHLSKPPTQCADKLVERRFDQRHKFFVLCQSRLTKTFPWTISGRYHALWKYISSNMDTLVLADFLFALYRRCFDGCGRALVAKLRI